MAPHEIPPGLSGLEVDMFMSSYHPHDQRQHRDGMSALHNPLSFLALPPTLPPALPILPRPVSYMQEEDSAMANVDDGIPVPVIFHHIEGGHAIAKGPQDDSRPWDSQVPSHTDSELASRINFGDGNELVMANSLEVSNFSQRESNLQTKNPLTIRHGHARHPSPLHQHASAPQQHHHRPYPSSDRIFKIPTRLARVKLQSGLYRASIEHALPSDGSMHQQFEAHFLQGLSPCYSGLSPSGPGYPTYDEQRSIRQFKKLRTTEQVAILRLTNRLLERCTPAFRSRIQQDAKTWPVPYLQYCEQTKKSPIHLILFLRAIRLFLCGYLVVEMVRVRNCHCSQGGFSTQRAQGHGQHAHLVPANNLSSNDLNDLIGLVFHGQLQSFRLLDLPTELRVMIYEEFISGGPTDQRQGLNLSHVNRGIRTEYSPILRSKIPAKLFPHQLANYITLFYPEVDPFSGRMKSSEVEGNLLISEPGVTRIQQGRTNLMPLLRLLSLSEKIVVNFAENGIFRKLFELRRKNWVRKYKEGTLHGFEIDYTAPRIHTFFVDLTMGCKLNRSNASKVLKGLFPANMRNSKRLKELETPGKVMVFKVPGMHARAFLTRVDV